MIRPKYTITYFDPCDRKSGFAGYVSYGLIFRKTERVGINLDLGEMYRICERHKDLVNPGKDFCLQVSLF